MLPGLSETKALMSCFRFSKKKDPRPPVPFIWVSREGRAKDTREDKVWRPICTREDQSKLQYTRNYKLADTACGIQVTLAHQDILI